jgi:hypothetical protein
MSKFLHVRPTYSFIGLPAGDLYSESLTPAQLLLLDAAVEAGVYVPFIEAVPVKQAEVSRGTYVKPKKAATIEREEEDGTIDKSESN